MSKILFGQLVIVQILNGSRVWSWIKMLTQYMNGVSHMKGLYFIGLPWLHTRASATLGGVKEDAEYIANHIENHVKKEVPQKFSEAEVS